MKTLILQGSPRKNGDTMMLVSEFLKHLEGEYKIVDTFYANIKPCIDCRYCRKNPGCSIKDGMQELYEYIQEADNILIASPLNFAELTGPLLSVSSRLQTYYCAEAFRNEKPFEKKKKGGIILVGGGDGAPDTAVKTAKLVLHHMNMSKIFPAVISHNTDRVLPRDDAQAMAEAKKLAEYFNENQ